MRPLRTVHGLLAERAGLALLADPMMERATGEILAGDRPRAEVQRDIKQKERAREAVVRRHRSAQLPEVRFQLFFAPRLMRGCHVLGTSLHRDQRGVALVCIKIDDGPHFFNSSLHQRNATCFELFFAPRSMMGHMSSGLLCIFTKEWIGSSACRPISGHMFVCIKTNEGLLFFA